MGAKAGGKIDSVLFVRLRPILEDTRESRPNPHSKPAEPAGRVAPRTNKRLGVCVAHFAWTTLPCGSLCVDDSLKARFGQRFEQR